MIDAYLLIDFGSTYTKLTLVDVVNEAIIATAKAITTVETNIMDGFNKAYENLCAKFDTKEVRIIKKLACSSAAGGLKMITIGLVPELTVEASKRAALGAGARVLKTYSFELTNAEIQEILNAKVDIILLSGGTDGGNSKTILHNARKIAEHIKHIPIIVAGNKCCYDEIKEIFDEASVNYVFTENVMPRLNVLNVVPVREKIREIFMKNIIKSKGMDEANNYIDGILMPTPAAVLKAGEILSQGTSKRNGIGDLIIVDIGGATTDVHSLADGHPTKAGINLKGLQEPFAKRTVEGDLGMRYSALALYEASGEKLIKEYIDVPDIETRCAYLHDHIDYVPQDDTDVAFDEALAKVATRLALNRHAGYLEIAYTPLGDIFNQYGKDLLETKYLIGTGGVIVHSKHPEAILKEGLYSPSEPTILKPKDPIIKIDYEYILSAMGLLAFDLPDCALNIMKRYIVEI